MSVPSTTWHNRMKYKTWHYYRDHGNQNRGKYYLNTLPDDTSSPDDEYPYKFEKPQEWELFINAYINIERFLTSIDQSDFSEKTMHLYDDFNSIALKLKRENYHLQEKDFIQVGSVFLRLFDTLPVYKYLSDSDNESWTVLLNAKYLASYLVRNDQLHFLRTRDAIQRWRYQMQNENKEDFKKWIYE